MLHGHVPNPAILGFYRNVSVTAFLNVSASEGGVPVAMMEAASVAIPLIATNVGGNPEIVSSSTGVLLEGNPSADSIVRAIETLAGPDVDAYRSNAHELWRTRFDASVLSWAFAARLAALGRPGQ
jgi:glycosyltransferase involved in cell wall biosynthesis